MRLVLPVFLALFSAFSLPAAADDAPGQTPEERRLRTDRLAAEGQCRAKRQAYDRAQERLDRALATETLELSIYYRAQGLGRARENYCLCLAQIWNVANPRQTASEGVEGVHHLRRLDPLHPQVHRDTAVTAQEGGRS
jgi:hypothetical protein